MVKKWRECLGLNTWRFEINYFRTGDYMPGEGDTVTFANITPQWKYLEAQLSFNMPQLAEMDDVQLEEIVVHELSHCLVDEMRAVEKDPDHEERVVSSIQRALMQVRDRATQGRI